MAWSGPFPGFRFHAWGKAGWVYASMVFTAGNCAWFRNFEQIRNKRVPNDPMRFKFQPCNAH